MSRFQDFSEAQSKLILDRINQSDQHIHSIATSIEGILRKESKLCNKLDDFACHLKNHQDSETYDESLEKLFEVMSSTIVHLADIESNKITRMQDKILKDLIRCGVSCSSARDEIKNFGTIRDFELNKRGQIHINSKKPRKNILVENEIMLSNMQISKILKEISTTAEKFESQKFIDMREIMLNFILIQLKYFSSGIEILTSAYQNVSELESSGSKFTDELKNINKQFKKSIEQDSFQESRFSFMRAALSKFSSSSSNVDMIGRQQRKGDSQKSQSSMSLNFLDSDQENVLHKESLDGTKEEDTTDSEDSDEEESSNVTPTDTENQQRH